MSKSAIVAVALVGSTVKTHTSYATCKVRNGGGLHELGSLLSNHWIDRTEVLAVVDTEYDFVSFPVPSTYR